jgi:hypothetical protein
MQTFRPCAGKNVCRENETHCLACGRRLDTVARTRELIEGIVNLSLEENYGNIDDFLDYVNRRVKKKIAHYRDNGA